MVNQNAAVCNYQATSTGRIAGTGVEMCFCVVLCDEPRRSSGVDRGIQNWAWSARNAPLQGRRRREEEGREGFSG
jgi:hypothetical protein